MAGRGRNLTGEGGEGSGVGGNSHIDEGCAASLLAKKMKMRKDFESISRESVGSTSPRSRMKSSEIGVSEMGEISVSEKNDLRDTMISQIPNKNSPRILSLQKNDVTSSPPHQRSSASPDSALSQPESSLEFPSVPSASVSPSPIRVSRDTRDARNVSRRSKIQEKYGEIQTTSQTTSSEQRDFEKSGPQEFEDRNQESSRLRNGRDIKEISTQKKESFSGSKRTSAPLLFDSNFRHTVEAAFHHNRMTRNMNVDLNLASTKRESSKNQMGIEQANLGRLSQELLLNSQVNTSGGILTTSSGSSSSSTAQVTDLNRVNPTLTSAIYKGNGSAIFDHQVNQLGSGGNTQQSESTKNEPVQVKNAGSAALTRVPLDLKKDLFVSPLVQERSFQWVCHEFFYVSPPKIRLFLIEHNFHFATVYPILEELNSRAKSIWARHNAGFLRALGKTACSFKFPEDENGPNVVGTSETVISSLISTGRAGETQEEFLLKFQEGLRNRTQKGLGALPDLGVDSSQDASQNAAQSPRGNGDLPGKRYGASTGRETAQEKTSSKGWGVLKFLFGDAEKTSSPNAKRSGDRNKARRSSRDRETAASSSLALDGQNSHSRDPQKESSIATGLNSTGLSSTGLHTVNTASVAAAATAANRKGNLQNLQMASVGANQLPASVGTGKFAVLAGYLARHPQTGEILALGRTINFSIYSNNAVLVLNSPEPKEQQKEQPKEQQKEQQEPTVSDSPKGSTEGGKVNQGGPFSGRKVGMKVGQKGTRHERPLSSEPNSPGRTHPNGTHPTDVSQDLYIKEMLFKFAHDRAFVRRHYTTKSGRKFVWGGRGGGSGSSGSGMFPSGSGSTSAKLLPSPEKVFGKGGNFSEKTNSSLATNSSPRSLATNSPRSPRSPRSPKNSEKLFRGKMPLEAFKFLSERQVAEDEALAWEVNMREHEGLSWGYCSGGDVYGISREISVELKEKEEEKEEKEEELVENSEKKEDQKEGENAEGLTQNESQNESQNGTTSPPVSSEFVSPVSEKTTLTLTCCNANTNKSNKSNKKTPVGLRREHFFLTCECCFDDEVQTEQAVHCYSGGHILCKTCVHRFVENLVSSNALGSLVVDKYAQNPGRLLCFCSEKCDSFLSQKFIQEEDYQALQKWWLRKTLIRMKKKLSEAGRKRYLSGETPPDRAMQQYFDLRLKKWKKIFEEIQKKSSQDLEERAENFQKKEKTSEDNDLLHDSEDHDSDLHDKQNLKGGLSKIPDSSWSQFFYRNCPFFSLLTEFCLKDDDFDIEILLSGQVGVHLALGGKGVRYMCSYFYNKVLSCRPVSAQQVYVGRADRTQTQNPRLSSHSQSQQLSSHSHSHSHSPLLYSQQLSPKIPISQSWLEDDVDDVYKKIELCPFCNAQAFFCRPYVHGMMKLPSSHPCCRQFSVLRKREGKSPEFKSSGGEPELLCRPVTVTASSTAGTAEEVWKKKKSGSKSESSLGGNTTQKENEDFIENELEEVSVLSEEQEDSARSKQETVREQSESDSVRSFRSPRSEISNSSISKISKDNTSNSSANSERSAEPTAEQTETRLDRENQERRTQTRQGHIVPLNGGNKSKNANPKTSAASQKTQIRKPFFVKFLLILKNPKKSFYNPSKLVLKNLPLHYRFFEDCLICMFTFVVGEFLFFSALKFVIAMQFGYLDDLFGRPFESQVPAYVPNPPIIRQAHYSDSDLYMGSVPNPHYPPVRFPSTRRHPDKFGDDFEKKKNESPTLTKTKEASSKNTFLDDAAESELSEADVSDNSADVSELSQKTLSLEEKLRSLESYPMRGRAIPIQIDGDGKMFDDDGDRIEFDAGFDPDLMKELMKDVVYQFENLILGKARRFEEHTQKLLGRKDLGFEREKDVEKGKISASEKDNEPGSAKRWRKIRLELSENLKTHLSSMSENSEKKEQNSESSKNDVEVEAKARSDANSNSLSGGSLDDLSDQKVGTNFPQNHDRIKNKTMTSILDYLSPIFIELPLSQSINELAEMEKNVEKLVMKMKSSEKMISVDEKEDSDSEEEEEEEEEKSETEEEDKEGAKDGSGQEVLARKQDSSDLAKLPLNDAEKLSEKAETLALRDAVFQQIKGLQQIKALRDRKVGDKGGERSRHSRERERQERERQEREIELRYQRERRLREQRLRDQEAERQRSYEYQVNQQQSQQRTGWSRSYLSLVFAVYDEWEALFIAWWMPNFFQILTRIFTTGFIYLIYIFLCFYVILFVHTHVVGNLILRFQYIPGRWKRRMCAWYEVAEYHRRRMVYEGLGSAGVRSSGGIASALSETEGNSESEESGNSRSGTYSSSSQSNVRNPLSYETQEGLNQKLRFLWITEWLNLFLYVIRKLWFLVLITGVFVVFYLPVVIFSELIWPICDACLMRLRLEEDKVYGNNDPNGKNKKNKSHFRRAADFEERMILLFVSCFGGGGKRRGQGIASKEESLQSLSESDGNVILESHEKLDNPFRFFTVDFWKSRLSDLFSKLKKFLKEVFYEKGALPAWNYAKKNWWEARVPWRHRERVRRHIDLIARIWNALPPLFRVEGVENQQGQAQAARRENEMRNLQNEVDLQNVHGGLDLNGENVGGNVRPQQVPIQAGQEAQDRIQIVGQPPQQAQGQPQQPLPAQPVAQPKMPKLKPRWTFFNFVASFWLKNFGEKDGKLGATKEGGDQKGKGEKGVNLSEVSDGQETNCVAENLRCSHCHILFCSRCLKEAHYIPYSKKDESRFKIRHTFLGGNERDAIGRRRFGGSGKRSIASLSDSDSDEVDEEGGREEEEEGGRFFFDQSKIRRRGDHIHSKITARSDEENQNRPVEDAGNSEDAESSSEESSSETEESSEENMTFQSFVLGYSGTLNSISHIVSEYAKSWLFANPFYPTSSLNNGKIHRSEPDLSRLESSIAALKNMEQRIQEEQLQFYVNLGRQLEREENARENSVLNRHNICLLPEEVVEQIGSQQTNVTTLFGGNSVRNSTPAFNRNQTNDLLKKSCKKISKNRDKDWSNFFNVPAMIPPPDANNQEIQQLIQLNDQLNDILGRFNILQGVIGAQLEVAVAEQNELDQRRRREALEEQGGAGLGVGGGGGGLNGVRGGRVGPARLRWDDENFVSEPRDEEEGLLGGLGGLGELVNFDWLTNGFNRGANWFNRNQGNAINPQGQQGIHQPENRNGDDGGDGNGNGGNEGGGDGNGNGGENPPQNPPPQPPPQNPPPKPTQLQLLKQLHLPLEFDHFAQLLFVIDRERQFLEAKKKQLENLNLHHKACSTDLPKTAEEASFLKYVSNQMTRQCVRVCPDCTILKFNNFVFK